MAHAPLPKPGRWYTSRQQAKAFIGLNQDNAEKDSRVDQLIAAASAEIERITDRRFIPVRAVRHYDWQGAGQLILDDDLLVLDELACDGVVIPPADYHLYPLSAPVYGEPHLWIELDLTRSQWLFSTTRQKAIRLAGLWGYSDVRRAETALAGDVSESATAIAFASGANLDVGMTIQVEGE